MEECNKSMIEAGWLNNGATQWRHYWVVFVARIRYYYATHGGLYTFADVLIENTLVQHKMAKSSPWRCVARIKRIGALATIMGFIVVSVSLP